MEGYFGPTYKNFVDISMPTMSTVGGDVNPSYNRKYTFSFMGAASHPLRNNLLSFKDAPKRRR